MRLVVFSHKKIWNYTNSEGQYATDGGFAFHMHALSTIFDETILVLPFIKTTSHAGEAKIEGYNIKVITTGDILDSDLKRKLRYPFWLIMNLPMIIKNLYGSDAVHIPIPSDLGTIPMLLAKVLKKATYIRHCGNWLKPSTSADKFIKRYMERNAGGNRVMLATGGSNYSPSSINPNVKWIFSSSLWEQDIISLKERRKVESFLDKRFKIVIAARQDSNKGTEEVIRSLPLLGDLLNTVIFTVIGDGNQLLFLKKLAKDLHCDNHIIFTGKLSHKDVLDNFLRSDLFCYPTSASEGFPKVVLEALACGLPVIATPVSVIPELLNKGCGTILKSTNPGEIAEKLKECIYNPDMLTSMRMKAQETASEFSLEKWRDIIKENLEESWGVKLKTIA